MSEKTALVNDRTSVVDLIRTPLEDLMRTKL
jgi:hypothetical protein